jgi:two-component system, chemotaxis family, chemotaxis protein CheY
MSKLAISDLSVLIVDDVRAMRAILKALLRTYGIQDFMEAGDGAEALNILRGNRRDLVITDLSMNPMDGLEFTRRLRQHSSGPNALVPVIVVSAHNEMSWVKDALEAGVTEFLLKPVTAAALGRRLNALVERPRAVIREKSYCGPDRRRRSVGAGKPRRAADLLAP